MMWGTDNVNFYVVGFLCFWAGFFQFQKNKPKKKREKSVSPLVEGEEYDRTGGVEGEEYDSEVEGEEDDRDGRRGGGGKRKSPNNKE